jgi:hypothetical protein
MISNHTYVGRLCLLVTLLIAIVVPIDSLMAAVIDDFDYNKKTVSHYWRSIGEGHQSPPATVAKGKPFDRLVTIFFCPFKQLAENETCQWQHNLEAELTGQAMLELDVYVENPEATKALSLWLQSPRGWLKHTARMEKQGWQTLRIALDDFQPIDGVGPGGKPLDAAHAIRLSINPMKGQEQDAYIAISQLRTEAGVKKADSPKLPVYNKISVESY